MPGENDCAGERRGQENDFPPMAAQPRPHERVQSDRTLIFIPSNPAAPPVIPNETVVILSEAKDLLISSPE